MLTRVVVVVFVWWVGMVVLRVDAQVTQPGGAAPTGEGDRGLPPAAIAPPVGAQPSAPVPAPSAPPAAPVPVTTTQPLVTTPPSTTRPTNRTAEETLRQMLQPQGEAARPLQPIPDAPPAVDATSGDGAVAPGGTPTKVTREGTLLLDRVGRLTRGDDGKTFEFTIDSDGRRMIDAPMILLPNRRLQQLEDRVQSSYRDLKIRASGEVMEYRGRNYLLLQRWSVVPEVVQPLQ
jgi:hypothetical protein